MIKSALRNPIAVLMVSLGLVLLGAMSLERLPVDLFPKLSVPVVIVGTSFPGAPPETVEQTITFPMEQAVAQAWNIDKVTSSTRQGLSIVYAWFKWGSDIDAALLDTQQQVQAIGDTLPEHARRPMIVKFDLSSLPVAYVSVKGGGLDERALYDLARNVITPQMSSVPGVAAATVSGGRRRQINVDLDPNKLRQTGLSLLDVEDTIRKANVVVPSGNLMSGRMAYDVFSNTQIKDVQELEDVVVKMVENDLAQGGRAGQIAVRVKDLGQVIDSHAEQNQIVRVDGERAVYMPIYKQPGSNTITTVEALREKLPNLNGVPPGVTLEVSFDQSNYIKNAISSLRHEAILGTSLAMLVVLLFLASFSGTLIVGLSLPLSVLVTLTVLYLTGETLNVFTLGGLALAVGRLVDNAIIVLENIHRHSHEGKSPLQAALDGTREVAAPVFAATLTTVIVFLPVWFLTGISKYLFTPMGLAISVAMFASYAVSLTVIPVLARALAGRGGAPSKPTSPIARLSNELLARVQRFLGRVDDGYARALERALARKKAVLLAVSAAFLASLGIATQIGSDFFPPVDEGEFQIAVRAPIGTRVDQTEVIVQRIEELVREIVPAEHVRSINTSVGAAKQGLRAMLASNTGPHAAKIRVEMSPAQERKHDVEHYISAVRSRVKEEFAGISITFDPRGSVRQIINFGYQAPIVVEARGYDLAEGSQLAARIEGMLRTVPGLADVKSVRQDDYPSLQIDVDRQRAARFDITQHDVARVLLGSVFGNTSRPPFMTDPKTGFNYDIITRLAESYRDMNDLSEVTLQHKEKPVLLRSIANIRRAVGPVDLARRDQQRVAEITANLLPGYDVGSVAEDIRAKLAALEIPAGFDVTLKGQSEEQADTNKSLVLALLVALGIVYMVMAAQFRSLTHPLIIMFTVPLGMIGVFVALFITNTSFSSTSMMGIIMMVGIVVANGILIVNYANLKREQGASPEEAALAAGKVRLRPILMTSLAVIFGLIPMALGGPGAETYAPLARAVMGGLLASTGLALFVIPILYILVERRFPTDLEARRADEEFLNTEAGGQGAP
jgi:hydrophobe/amphiphile efflux-1 (HAE1) family protein